MELVCDHARHIVLKVEAGPKATKFISKVNKVVDIHKLPNDKFITEYPYRYEDYPLADYAVKMLNQHSLGVVVTSRAKALLSTLIKEPIMGKISAPVKNAPEAPAKNDKPAKVAKVAKPVTETADSGEKAPRNRRDKIDGEKRVKVLGQNPARTGTMRHAIVDTIFKAKTVQEAVSSSVERKDSTEYKIGLPDVYFCLENNLIELY